MEILKDERQLQIFKRVEGEAQSVERKIREIGEIAENALVELLVAIVKKKQK